MERTQDDNIIKELMLNIGNPNQPGMSEFLIWSVLKITTSSKSSCCSGTWIHLVVVIQHLAPERLKAWLQHLQRAESAVAAWQQHWRAPLTADLSWLFRN